LSASFAQVTAVNKKGPRDCAPKRRPIGWKVPEHRLSFVGFHTFRHSWATWLRRYGGADVQGLAATGNWRDPKSAERYSHVVAREEWERVEKLPAMGHRESEPGNRRGKVVNE
jgi:integrase